MNVAFLPAALCPGILLGVGAYQDIKRKEMSVWPILVFGVIGIAGLSLRLKGFPTVPEALAGAAVGAAVMAVSHLAKGAIGMGDGMLLAVTGLYLGFWDNMGIFLCGAFLAAILSAILLLMKKATKKTEYPFAPFLLLGFLCVKLL